MESVGFGVITTACFRKAALLALSSQSTEAGGVQPLRKMAAKLSSTLTSLPRTNGSSMTSRPSRVT